MEHENYKVLLPLHALASLDQDEAQSLEEHLATCAACRAELDGWQATASSLAYAATPLEPSPQVRQRILETVRAEKRNVIPMVRPASLVSTPKPVSRAWQAIAAIVILGLIVGLAMMWRQTQQSRATIADLKSKLEDTSSRLEKEIIGLQVLTAPGAKMAELAGTKEAPGAHAMLAVDGKNKRAVFMAQGLPQPPPGKAYQLWFISGSKPMPGKVFKTDASGNAMMMDEQVPTEALAAGTFAVTLEPQEGVSAPTGSMYLMSPAG
ncbi:MAG TPA: anti-sigma factor [Pyrinomonadaceae bacterium]|nr:anti-sigma factor [Pyrinomonadaceae bacterium]